MQLELNIQQRERGLTWPLGHRVTAHGTGSETSLMNAKPDKGQERPRSAIPRALGNKEL